MLGAFSAAAVVPDAIRAVVVVALAATIALCAKLMASRRIAFDQALTAAYEATIGQHRTEAAMPTPAPHCDAKASAHVYRPPPSPKGLDMLRIYWPSDALVAPGTIYGWSFLDGHERVVVVAGVATAHCTTRHVAGLDAPIILGNCVLEDAACDALIQRSGPLSLYVMLQPVPHWTRLCTGDTLAPTCRVSFFIYEKPNALLLERLVYDPCLPRPMSPRLERLLQMDPVIHAQKRNSSESALSRALAHMNAARWALEAPPHPSPWLAASRQALNALHIPRDFTVAMPMCRASEIVRLLDRRMHHIAAWPAYLDWLHRVQQHVAAGQGLDLKEAQSAATAAWNGLLVSLVDMALGTTMGYAIEQHRTALVAATTAALRCSDAAAFHVAFDWMAHWPLGIKLNTELALFLRDALGSLVNVHTRYVLDNVATHASLLVSYAAWMSTLLGASALLAVLTDACGILGLHVTVMYCILRSVYAFFMRAASELFDVFRGKKRNPLHGGRLDEAQYDVDQLFLGTILFTLLVFLFPTIFLYYMACALAQWLLCAVRATLTSAMGVLGSLPLYELVMRTWHPACISDGLVWERKRSTWYMYARPRSFGTVCAACAVQIAPLTALPRLALEALTGAPMHLAAPKT